MILNTGFGYLKDLGGHIISKFDLPIGEHVFSDNVVIFELPNRKSLDGINVYVEPKTDNDLIEDKIKKEEYKIVRDQAINILKQRGEIPQDYN